MNETASTSSDSAATDRAMRRRRTTGIILLIIGGVALLSRSFAWNLGLMTPLFLGVIFLVWAVLARVGGLLIPGGILTGIGAGLLVQRHADLGQDFHHAAFLLCFAAGWLLIPALAWLVFKRRMLWPLWPAAALAFAGVVRLEVALFLLFTKPRARV